MDPKLGAQEHWIQEKISNGRDIPMYIRQGLKLMEGKARRIESELLLIIVLKIRIIN